MVANRLINAVWPVIIIGVCMAAGVLAIGAANAPRDRHINIRAHKYAYDPPVIHVNRGDRVTIHLSSEDVTHGFYLEGYDIDAQVTPGEKTLFRHPSQGPTFQKVTDFTFIANRPGKFRYRCSVTCGFMHPFMLGEMVVAPNRPFGLGLGAAVGIAVAMLFMAARKGGRDQ